MKVKDGIIGFLIGDALGVPVEFSTREYLSQNPVVDMQGEGTYNQPKGTWSDDTAMTLATMASIINKKGIAYTDMMDEFCNWAFNAEYLQGDDVFDIGNTTHNALLNYKYGKPALESGGSEIRDNGNGSLMRILPLAYLPDIDYESIENVSALTHAHNISKISCVLYVEIAKSMILNDDLTIDEHINNAIEKIKEFYNDYEELEAFKNRFASDFSEISGKGYVIYTFECVLYCLKTTDNYKDADLKAVNIGGDTDTNAAICGGLAGIYYGFDEIPVDWISQISKIEEVFSLCERYEAYCDGC